MSDYVKNISSSDFDGIIGKQGILLIDFWAQWCAPCNLMAPVIEAIAEKYKDKLSVCKLNTDEYPEISSKYKITGIPTLIVFKDGKEIDRLVGYKAQEVIEGMIEKQF